MCVSRSSLGVCNEGNNWKTWVLGPGWGEGGEAWIWRLHASAGCESSGLTSHSGDRTYVDLKDMGIQIHTLSREETD